ncbi:MAG TPA: alpha/beta hydrolase [Sporichthyaceae bacterium]|jgi:pimeloyl-ACP methyl ester carboxylesterase
MTVQEHDVALPGGHLRVLEVGRPGALPAADSEVVVLVHGLAGGAATWAPLLAELDRRDVAFPVIAPDLIGHPNADYSLGGYANEIRDLLTARGHRRATIVGHSLGGGIALQFCYQYPQICGRLVLVDAGGLGPELHPVLRAATLPGAEWALPLLAHTRVISTVGWLVDSGRAILGRGTTGHHTLSAFGSLADGARRRAFVITARNIINIAGQRVSGVDKLHLTAEVPTMIVWGGRDPIIPAAHARQATAALPDARVEVFENAGHFPHCDEPVRFADLLLDFLAGTTPAPYSTQR